jgi:hypothetical protein
VKLPGWRRRERKRLEGRRGELVVEYLSEWWRLCADVGPWQYAADLGAHVDADLRAIAYLAVYNDLAGSSFADDDYFLDEAISVAYCGFCAYLSAHPAAAQPG